MLSCSFGACLLRAVFGSIGWYGSWGSGAGFPCSIRFASRPPPPALCSGTSPGSPGEAVGAFFVSLRIWARVRVWISQRVMVGTSGDVSVWRRRWCGSVRPGSRGMGGLVGGVDGAGGEGGVGVGTRASPFGSKHGTVRFRGRLDRCVRGHGAKVSRPAGGSSGNPPMSTIQRTDVDIEAQRGLPEAFWKPVPRSEVPRRPPPGVRSEASLSSPREIGWEASRWSLNAGRAGADEGVLRYSRRSFLADWDSFTLPVLAKAFGRCLPATFAAEADGAVGHGGMAASLARQDAGGKQLFGTGYFLAVPGK